MGTVLWLGRRLLGRRRVNGKLLIGLIVTIVLLGTGVHFLHAYQIKRQAGVLYRQALRAEEEGRSADVAKYLDTYVRLEPTDTDALEKLGLALVKEAKSPRELLFAYGRLEQVVRQDPQRHEIRRQIGEIGIRIGYFRSVVGHLETLHRQFPNDGEVAYLLGVCYENLKQEARAREQYEAAIEKAPSRIPAYVALARLLRKGGQTDQATGIMNRLVQANPKSHEAYLERALYRKQVGDITGAAADVNWALAEAPHDAAVLLLAADIAQAAKQTNEARRHLQLGVEHHRKDARMYLALARLELLADRRDDALTCIRQGLDNLPDHTLLLAELTPLLIDKGELGVAAETIERLRQRSDLPVAQPAWFDFFDACLLMQKKEWSEASRLLERVRPHVASVPELTGVVEMRLALCYQQRGEPDRQAEALERALKAGSTKLDVNGRLAKAELLATTGKVEEALRLHQELVADLPSVRFRMVPLLIARALRQPAAQQAPYWQEVERTLEAAARDGSRAVEVLILRAEVTAAKGNLGLATEQLARARSEQPAQLLLWLAYAHFLERQGKLDEALDVLQKAKDRFGRQVGLNLALAFHWGRRPGEQASLALVELEKDREHLKPDEQEALLRGLAAVYTARSDYKQAQRLLAEVAGMRPHDLGLRLAQLEVARQMGDEALVQHLLDEIEKMERGRGTTWSYGRACQLIVAADKGGHTQGVAQLAEAQTLLTQVRQQRPHWPAVPLREANLMDLQGQTARAVELYLQAIDLGDRNPHVIRRAVQLLAKHERFTQIDQLMEKLRQANALTPELRHVAWSLWAQRGHQDWVLTAAREAVERGSKDFRDHYWYAQLLAAEKQDREAETVLRQACERIGHVPETWVALAQHLARTGQQDKIAAVIDQATRALPEDKRVSALASLYELAGQVDKAGEHYQTLLKAKPNDVATLCRVAAFGIRTQQPGQAEPLLRKILEPSSKASEPEAAWARRSLAVVLAASRTYPRYQEAVKLVPDDAKAGSAPPEERLARATVLAMGPGRAQHREAVRLFEELREKGHPLAPVQLFLLAQLREEDNHWSEARKVFEALLSTSENQQFLGHYIRRLVANDLLDDAAKWHAKLETLAPKAFATVELKGQILKAHGKVEEAVALLEAAVAPATVPEEDLFVAAGVVESWRQPAAAERLYQKFADRSKRPTRALAVAEFFARQGRVDKALDWCEATAGTLPLETVAGACVTMLAVGGGNAAQCQRAAGWLEKALEKAPKSSILIANQAMLRNLQGRYPEAEQLYRQALALDAHNIMALNNLACLLARTDGARRGEAALELVNRCMDLVGPSPALLDTRALIYLRKGGHTAQALKDLEDAIALSPVPEYYFRLAEVRWQAGNKSAAAAALKRAIATGLKPERLHALDQPAYRDMVSQLTPQ
jgi:tetratricopeptide (TPR) repeat protein